MSIFLVISQFFLRIRKERFYAYLQDSKNNINKKDEYKFFLKQILFIIVILVFYYFR